MGCTSSKPLHRRIPSPRSAPPCRDCGYPNSVRNFCGASNRNGNAGRPQYTCGSPACDAFICFDDERGIHRGNPRCWCGEPARAILMGASAGSYFWGGARGSFFRCARGRCDFRAEGEMTELGNGAVSVEEAVRAGF